jgi:hypothetical protein
MDSYRNPVHSHHDPSTHIRRQKARTCGNFRSLHGALVLLGCFHQCGVLVEEAVEGFVDDLQLRGQLAFADGAGIYLLPPGALCCLWFVDCGLCCL